MSITEPSRGYAGQPQPVSRPSYPYAADSSPYPPIENVRRSSAENHNSSYPVENSDRGRMHLPPPPPPLTPLPPIRPRDEQQQQQFSHYKPYHQDPHQAPQQNQQQLGSNHPLYISQQTTAAPLQHLYQPSKPVEYSRPPYHAETQPLQGQDRMGSPVQEEHGTPLAQRRQSRKISQRKEFPAHKSRTDEPSSAQPRLRYDERSASAQTEAASNQRLLDADRPSAPETSQKNQPSRPMPISRLLSDDNGGSARPAGPQYKIRVRQQPLAARACGFGERDRRVIDPPPILQLSIEDPTATPAEISELIRQPYSVVHCTLWNPLTDRDDTAMPGSSDKRQQRRLMGTLVASPFVGLDENDVEGCFFCFPDLSVRTAGMYSLKFSLVVLDPKKMMLGNSVPVRATVMSDSFQVYNAKDFIGMRASTELTKRLKHQGCLISVKKGNAKTNASHARDEDDDDEEDDDDDGAPHVSSKQRGKRPKR